MVKSERKKGMRKHKVYETTVQRKNNWQGYKIVPQIRLQGQWLQELGFEPGVQMNIECSGGKLVITIADEVIME